MADEGSSYEITQVWQHADIATDGSAVTLYLTAGADKEVKLRLSFRLLELLAVYVTKTFAVARTRSESTATHQEIGLSRAVGISAQSPEGGRVVALSVQTEDGLEHRFALHPTQSAGLREQMRQAEADAIREGQQTRQ